MVPSPSFWEQRAASGLAASTSVPTFQLPSIYSTGLPDPRRRQSRGTSSHLHQKVILWTAACEFQLLLSECQGFGADACSDYSHSLPCTFTGCRSEHSQQNFWQPHRKLRSRRVQQDCQLTAQQLVVNGVQPELTNLPDPAPAMPSGTLMPSSFSASSISHNGLSKRRH